MLIRNFLFHRVSDEKDAMWPPMTPALFTKVIEYLARNYRVVALEEFLDNPGSFRNSKSLATISFDDGYRDNIEFAAPILKKLNCNASFYVVTDCIDRNIPTWTYIIDHAIQSTRKKSISLNYSFVPQGLQNVSLDQPVARTIKPWMKKLSNHERVLITEAIIGQCDDVNLPTGKMMSWDEVRQLNSAGFIIGSHSHTHPMLASLADSREITDELVISSNRLQHELGSSPLAISYPIGSYDERVTAISATAGYKYGLAVEQKFFSYPSDTMKIPRVELYQESWNKLQLHLSGNYWNRLKRLVR